MIGTYGAAILICAASLLVGHAFLHSIGSRSWRWLEPGVGFALLIGVGGAVAWISGNGRAVSVALLALALAALLLCLRSPLAVEGWRAALAIAVLILVALAVPLVSAGHQGVLDAPELHLQLGWGDWLRGGPPPPWKNVLGPAALADALARIPGISQAQAFQGELAAIVVLSGLTALGAIGHLTPGRRVIAACMVALTYLSICFFGLAAAWTTTEALLMLTTAVATLQLERGIRTGQHVGNHAPRLGIALALAVGAGIFFSNSVAGLIWPVAISARWSLNLPEVRARLRPGSLPRLLIEPVTILALAAVAGMALLAAVEFVPFSINRLASAASTHAVAAAPGFGVWPHGSYPLTDSYGVAGWSAMLLAAVTVALASLWWLDRAETSIPIAVGVASIFWLSQRHFKQEHGPAQALAIVAPLAMLMMTRPLLEELRGDATPRARARPAPHFPEIPEPPRPVWAILAVLFIAAAVCSSGLALAQLA